MPLAARRFRNLCLVREWDRGLFLITGTARYQRRHVRRGELAPRLTGTGRSEHFKVRLV